jgi:hypothetical protein
MKNLKAATSATFVLLVGIIAFGMDTRKDQVNANDIDLSACSLGEKMPIGNFIKQKLLIKNESIGFLMYRPDPENVTGCFFMHILIENLEYRNKGLGVQFVRLFIGQAKRDGFTAIRLLAVSKAVSLYQRLDFEIIKIDPPFTEMILTF